MDIEEKLRRIGVRLTESRRTADANFARARAAAVEGLDAGLTQQRVARLLGVDRMTIRNWLEKK